MTYLWSRGISYTSRNRGKTIMPSSGRAKPSHRRRVVNASQIERERERERDFRDKNRPRIRVSVARHCAATRGMREL